MSRKKTNNAVIRTCVICREKFIKSSLLRFIVTEDVIFDLNQNIPGRGCYICLNDLLYDKSRKKNSFFKRSSEELICMLKNSIRGSVRKLSVNIQDNTLKSEVLDLLTKDNCEDFKFNFNKIRKSLVIKNLSVVNKADDMLSKLCKINCL